MAIKTIYFAPLLAAVLAATGLHAQTINMHWPKFAGKTYDFIIFQGDKTVTAQQGIIPPDGRFELKVPKEYAPYTGMCRWLITNSSSGGGLDMAIPGKGYSVSCTDSTPSAKNIVYKGYDPVNALNSLFNDQQLIIDKHTTMARAMQLYGSSSKLYPTLETEKKAQEQAYQDFRTKLKSNTNYAARFLPIVNLTRGIAPRLSDDYEATGTSIARYMADEMNMDDLYTSGHWTGLISNWAQLQANVIDNDSALVADFVKMGSRISEPERYTDFVDKVTYYLSRAGKDAQLELLAPIIKQSGKITEYKGVLAVYQGVLIGESAPDIIIREYFGKPGSKDYVNTKLESRNFAGNDYQKTLVVFYESGCGPCEQLMQQLPGNYELLKSKGIRIIAIAADKDENVFKNTSRNFPWKDTYCDYEGKNGTNFKSYGAVGTPMIFLVDKAGKIKAKMSTAEEVLSMAKNGKR